MSLSLIAPQSGFVPGSLVTRHPLEYEGAIAEIQRFRGRIYAHDKAIPVSALDASGRHRSELDYHAWHIVARNADGLICGVIRVPIYKIGTELALFELHHALDRMEPALQTLYGNVIRDFLNHSARDYSFVCEPGGWAVDKHLCNRLTGVTLAAAIWALGAHFGGYCAIATATTKHHAADILTKMGGFNPLAGTPYAHFYDVFFRSGMAFVFFQSDSFNAQFTGLIAKADDQLTMVQKVEETRILSGRYEAAYV
ncbi:hypothetical protein [Spirosoma arcticum]